MEYMERKADEQIEAGLSQYEEMCAEIESLKKHNEILIEALKQYVGCFIKKNQKYDDLSGSFYGGESFFVADDCLKEIGVEL